MIYIELLNKLSPSRPPSCFCTLSTFDCFHELVGCLTSINYYHPSAVVYLACDKQSAKMLGMYFFPGLQVKKFLLTNEFSGLGRQQLEEKNLFGKLMSLKMHILRLALQFEKDALYIDSDVFLLDTITINPDMELILSPAYINKQLQESKGIYNAGYLWTSSPKFVNEWQFMLPMSKYYDQHILGSICNNYKHSSFSEQHNIMPWRLIIPLGKKVDFINRLFVKEGKIFLGADSLKSIHTHLLGRRDFIEFNKLILGLMIKANDSIGLNIINAILSSQSYRIDHKPA